MTFNISETTLGILIAECNGNFYSHMYDEINRNEDNFYYWTEISKELYNLLKAEQGTSSYQEEVFEHPVWCEKTHNKVERAECIYDDALECYVHLSNSERQKYVWSNYENDNILMESAVFIPSHNDWVYLESYYGELVDIIPAQEKECLEAIIKSN